MPSGLLTIVKPLQDTVMAHDDLISGQAAAHLAGITRQRWHQLWLAGLTPPPQVMHPMRLWSTNEVKAWVAQRHG